MIALLLLLAQDPHYPLAAGHTWTYAGPDGKDYVRSVASFDAEKKQYRIEEPFMKEGFTLDADGLRHRGNALWIKFPLKKGETWSDEKQKVKGAVEDEEDVEVPAGKYKTFRVKVTTEAFELTLWLAKDVGEVKRAIKLGENTVTLALKSFQKGGAK